MRCFAAICKETRHITEMVARQKSSKKPGRSQLVNCTMRFKPSNPYMLNGAFHNVLPGNNLMMLYISDDFCCLYVNLFVCLYIQL